MKIKRIETFTTQYVGFVRITDEEGRQGTGQVSTYNSDITSSVLHRQVAPYVLGVPFDDIDVLTDRVIEREHKFPGSYMKRALGGLDTAIWDLRGKLAGQPVVSLLGGTPGKLRAYASSMKRDITPAAEAERFRRLQGQFGFDAFKFRVAAEYGHDVDEWPGRTEDIIPTIRKALGDKAALLVDANSGFSPRRAIEVGALLKDNGIEHFEEPCLYWELEQTKEVTDALDIAVTGGEQDCEIQTWRRMIEMRAVDIVQPDILYLGGISRTLRVCAMARAAGLPVTPHSANLGLVTLFTMHLLRAIEGAGKYLEFSIEGPDYYPWQEGLFVKSPYTVENGMVAVSDEPGWGIEVDPEWLAKSSYQMSEAA
ncbi:MULTISPECIES: mandelate racemase/muconate lactonizing enzyme family protein [Phyllobacteriaceae]|uniref:Mandelate racemase n=1 Tax=Mesorhizobium hungaricum TaxID=1566387 RepID=A0A1C2E100_9HYPH|nr:MULTISPECIES: mandelate racemase/muconate lactonizing enzyme family protein [Mesorhizobium]MBN9235570.1 mandelate racemase/muconate lactonizing enzyme family protein [Mesorhizobium sp.]MDQ0331277.1 L-alanine-DL-glutamate epimerase-like enolase superfamily enzyme [Mesorhizobium sp. YL-MeA3-2017]OCX20700.1 mandelate racemase [Mesorhizobium hungaricum]